MKRITKIEENNALSVKTKTRVAAYCRVSTASDEQLISLDTQKAHYEDYIKSNSEWEYAGVFFDEGITGTKKECRDGLNSLIDSCEKGLGGLGHYKVHQPIQQKYNRLFGTGKKADGAKCDRDFRERKY